MEGRPPPCETKGACYITGRPAEDEDLPMLLNGDESWLVFSHDEITGISDRERVEQHRKDGKVKILYLPTLSHLKLWMDMCDWGTAPFEPDEFFQLVTAYHRSYVDQLLGT